MPGVYLNLLKKATVLLVIAAFIGSASSARARTPNDSFYAAQEPMWNQINAPAAWDKSTGSRAVVVAIIDTGADTWHEDLRENIWRNPYEIADNGRDDDGNGFVDDAHGWNFVEHNNDVRTSVFGSDDDAGAVSHGTLIAGLIGGRGDNNRDGTGVNWQVQIMPLRAVASSGSGAVSAVTEAINYAVQNGAAVINLSVEGEAIDDEFLAALRNAYQHGVVVVTAAGNHPRGASGDLDRTPAYPACTDRSDDENWLITVSSVDAADKLSAFANYGSCVDIVAPGQNIFSTERYAPQYGYANEFKGGWKGTSFSAPLVAGAAALIKSIRPDWGAQQIIPALLQSADPVDQLNPGYEGKIGRGRLNIGRAAALAAEGAPHSLADGFFYANSGQLYHYDFPSRTPVLKARVTGARLVALASGSGMEGAPLVALLIQREKFFYLRLLKANGSLWREFPVVSTPGQSSRARFIPSRLHFFTGDDDQPRFLLEEFNAKSKITNFSEYSLSGKRSRVFTLPGVVASWAVSPRGMLAIATRKKQGFLIRQLNWATRQENAMLFPWISAIDDLAAGPFSGDGRDVAVVIARRAGESVQLVIDGASQSYRRDPLLNQLAGPWRISISESAPGKPAYLARFHPSGLFTIVDQQNRELFSQGNLPREGIFE